MKDRAAAAGAALLVGSAGWLGYRLYPAQHRLPANPSFVDSVFANNLVLFASRLVLVAAALVLAVTAVFVVASYWQRAKAGHWLTRFGPLKTEALEDLRAEVKTWQQEWLETTIRAGELQVRIEHADRLIAQLREQLGET
jgi:hypothetical protein